MKSILSILFISLGFFMPNKYGEYHPSKGEQLVNSILANTAKIIKDKYNLKPCGMGAAMPGGPIQELTLCFDTKYPHTQEQLRTLLIKSGQELLNQVNENDDIQEFLFERPFSIINIQIIIYNHDKDGRQLNYPEISDAQIIQGLFMYSCVDPLDTFRYKSEFTETYEEALQKQSAVD
jgi:hypothetical protein